MQNTDLQDDKQKRQNDFLKNCIRKILIYVVSVLLVSGIVLGIVSIRNWKLQKEAERIEAAENAAKEEAKAAMTEQEIQALYENSVLETSAAEAEENKEVDTDSTEAEETVAEAYGSPIDFENLWEVNQDVYAWIRVPGTVIDYPILQHATDNTYYLNYNIDGSYGYPGCIYTENLNNKDFTDNNTVIYGHNMKNGSMFAGLHQYEDMNFLEENDKVYIYTPEKQLTYTIFAAYVYDDRHLLYSFDFSNEDVYTAYLEDVISMRDLSANIRTDMTVTHEDCIITLVTCMSKQPDKRLLVQAVLEE